MSVTRRNILQGLVLGSTAAALPRFARAEFPPQDTIDNDPLRPRYHLMPRRGWMNDPCAPVHYNGRYHMFFQYNPGASVWGDRHWGHAVSTDMVHWSERPMALAPTPGGPDSFGVFTGTMVMDKGVPTILYTCVSPSSAELATLWGSKPPEREQQCLATPLRARNSDPDAVLDSWSKLPRPVIPSPPPGMKVTGFRDPTPWREADGWYMLLASGQKGVGGNVLLYKSQDLRRWEFQHIFAQGKPNGQQTSDTVDSGEMWECPDFFPLGDGHVLIHSVGSAEGRKTLWQSGHLEKATMRFTVQREGELNHGPYYAPKTQLDADGNRILWGWIPEDRPEAEFAKVGWAGCMSLPRVLTLEDGWLRFKPAEQVSKLRGPVQNDITKLSGTTLLQNETVLLAPSKWADGVSPGLEHGFANALLIVESSGDKFLWNGKPLPSNIPDSAGLELRCFCDHSVVEVFLGKSIVLTHRVYNRETPARLTLPRWQGLVGARAYPMQKV